MKKPNLFHNILALGSVQAAGLLLPMVTLPYVTHALGVEAWGQVAFVQSVLAYFSLVINWGFSWSATRKISALRDDITQLSSVFIATWMAQWVLAFLVSAVLITLVIFVPFFNKDSIFYFYGVGLVVSGALFPAWFLNGLERMKAVASIQIIVRLLNLPCIFLLINNPKDAPLMIAIGAGTGLLSGIITILWVLKNVPLQWHRPSFLQIWQQLKEGGTIFGSTAFISLYTTLTPTILGIIAGPVAVGHFALADRVRQAAQAGLGTISEALFPRMSHLFTHDPIQANRLLKHSGICITLMSASVSIGLWYGSDNIVYLLGGKDFMQASVVLKWLAPLPFIIGLSNLFGVQIMLAKGMSREVNNVLFIAGILSLLIIKPMIEWKMEEGAAINILFIEILVTLGLFLTLLKNNLSKKHANFKT